MLHANERKVISNLVKETPNQLVAHFCMSQPTSHTYRFEEYGNPKHYVTVATEKPREGFGALVNADFGFARPAGSNNYPELLDLGRKLAAAFDVKHKW